MSGIHVMSPAEGAAVRYQLDAMIKTLRELGPPAREAGDQEVINLLDGLCAAWRAAVQIEDRKSHSTQGRGVLLTKR